MKICCHIRRSPHYRRDAFVSGVKRIGGRLTDELDCDVLVIWNRYGPFRKLADTVEKRGGTVLVAENGYLGNEWAGDRWYAMSRTHHNGAGRWPDGGPERWDSLGVELSPWRTEGRELVLLPQRGIGPPGVAMPGGWASTAKAQLASGLPVRVRPHPGQRVAIDLAHDLRKAAAVATWGSGGALKALAWGIPCYHGLQSWIGAPASRPIAEAARGPLRDDARRLGMFRRLIWAQWRLSEIASGEAFDCLLAL